MILFSPSIAGCIHATVSYFISVFVCMSMFGVCRSLAMFVLSCGQDVF